MIVMKFGGTSVGSAERIKGVYNIVKLFMNKKPVVVVSAVGGITDKLINAANNAKNGEDYESILNEIYQKHKTILKDLNLNENMINHLLDEFSELINKIAKTKETNKEIMDLVQSFGERMSVRIVAAYFSAQGTKSKAFDAFDIGMITDSNFGSAEPLESSPAEIKKAFSKIKELPIVTGFIGKDTAGTITTLGRGGSDYTGAIIGAAIDCEEIQIWTDVSGIMTSDPRIVKNPKTLEHVSFAEASELAYFGAKVLHPKTILPAMKKNIPVKVLNSFAPTGKGTTIVNKEQPTKEIIKAIATKKGVTIININSLRMLFSYGFLAKIFNVFEDYQKSVDMISTSEVSVSLTVDNDENLQKIVDELKEIADIKVERNNAIVCLVGAGMFHAKGLAGRIFTTLGKNNINIEMISQGASEINVSLVVKQEDADKAMQVLHQEFFG